MFNLTYKSLIHVKRCRACIANGMVIFYVTRSEKKNADRSFNTLGEALWASAEISFGIIVTCIFTLPKFVEAKGAKIQAICSSITRPLTSLMSGSFGHLMPSKESPTASQGPTLNRVNTSNHLTGEFSFINRDQDLESCLSQDDAQDLNKYPSTKAPQAPHES